MPTRGTSTCSPGIENAVDRTRSKYGWPSVEAHCSGLERRTLVDTDRWTSRPPPEVWKATLRESDDDRIVEGVREATRAGRPLASDSFIAENRGAAPPFAGSAMPSAAARLRRRGPLARHIVPSPMARTARLVIPGLRHHVTQSWGGCGNNRQDVRFTDNHHNLPAPHLAWPRLVSVALHGPVTVHLR